MLIRNEDKINPVKKLNIVVSLAHLALQGVENFSLLYQGLNDVVLGPSDTKHTPYIYSLQQETLYAQFVQLQREFQLDVTELLTNVARVAAGAFTGSLDKSSRARSRPRGSRDWC